MVQGVAISRDAALDDRDVGHDLRGDGPRGISPGRRPVAGAGGVLPAAGGDAGPHAEVLPAAGPRRGDELGAAAVPPGGGPGEQDRGERRRHPPRLPQVRLDGQRVPRALPPSWIGPPPGLDLPR
eukprot:4650230-Pyramimonas_sp.AAC.1